MRSSARQRVTTYITSIYRGDLISEIIRYMLRYLQNTAYLAIQYNASDPEATIPIGYTGSDFAGDTVDRKSTSGYVFILAGGAIT